MTREDFEVHDSGTHNLLEIQKRTIEEQRKEIATLNRIRAEQDAALTLMSQELERLRRMVRPTEEEKCN